MSADRRKEQKNKRGGGRFIFSTLSFIVICAALGLGMSVFFRVSNIEVNGASHYSESDVIAASGIKNGDNLMFLNRQDIQEKIYSKLIYIGTVRVSRKLPNTVVIDVDESGTVACVDTDSGKWLIDKNCRLLEPFDASGDNGTCISVVGLSGVKPAKGNTLNVADEDKPKEAYLAAILAAMSNGNVLADVSSVDMSNVSNAQFKYMGRFTVKLGKNENLDYKLGLLPGVTAKLGSEDSGTIDLSQDKKAQFSPYE